MMSASKLKELKQIRLSKREFHGVRYAFGSARDRTSLADIFGDLKKRNLEDDDAKKTIDDVLVACDYGKYVGDIPALIRHNRFLIHNFKDNFSPQEINGMQERALFVKVINNLFDRGKWKEFVDYAAGWINNESGDIFDVLRELESKKEIDFLVFQEILNFMDELKQLDVLKAYTEETGNSVLDESKVHDYDWQVSKIKLRRIGRILRENYSSWKDIPVNEWFWPPLCRTQYITLALVSNQSYSREDYFTHKSLHNQPEDDLPYHKSEISFKDIFPEREEESFSTLVSGRPGIGKTVLLTKVCKEWANHNCLKNTNALIHVSLRDLHGKTSKPTLLDILEMNFANSENCKEFCKHIENVSGRGVCFAFDGLDEYPLLNTTGDIVTSIIGKQKLSSASVIVTSRPTDSHKVKRVMKQHAEIIGFMPKEIESYVCEYYDDKKASAKILLDYLEDHPNVKDMCFLPLHLAMIVHLNDVKRSQFLPETESDVYHRFVSHSVIRYILRERKSENDDVYIETFNEMKEFLNDDEYELFKLICIIAFHSRAQSRIKFSTQDITKRFPCQISPSQLKRFKNNGLGIVSSYPVYTENGRTRHYSFQHLTFQEFLAAYYISELDEHEYFNVLKAYGDKPGMKEVWKFFFGIMKNHPTLPSLFQKIAKRNPKHGADTLFLSRCVFETQSESGSKYSEKLCQELIQSRDRKFNISNVILSAPDCSAIGFVLRSTADIVMDLMMNYCQVGQNEFSALKRQIERCEGFQKLKNFQIRSQLNPLKQEGADDLGSVLSKMPKLCELRLYGNQLETDKLLRISLPIKKMNHLQILVLTKNSLGPDCGETISELLEHYPNLIQFYASYNPLTTEGLRNIMPGLLKCKKLRRLGLRGCSLDENAGELLSQVLVDLQFLEQLELYWNCLGDNGVRHLSTSLQNAPRLQQVSFTKNEIGDEGGCLLAQAVGNSQSIQQIRVYYNNISSTTRSAFYEVAKKKEKTGGELKYAL